jgi:hypothetical protein
MNARNERDDSPSISERVVETVADVVDTDPMELDPLYDSIDTTSLNRLFESASDDTPRDRGHVAFPMAGCQVVVYADGTIVVDSDDEQRTVSLPDVPDGRPLRASKSSD